MIKINNLLKKLIIPTLALIIIAVLSAGCFQELLTPCFIDPEAIEYSEQGPHSFLPITTLSDAKRIQRHMERRHDLNQTELVRLMEDETKVYAFLTNAMVVNISNAEELRGTLFSPTGPVGLLAASLPAFGIGLLLSKPGDKKKIIELEKTNGSA